jgi:hypothetical protein
MAAFGVNAPRIDTRVFEHRVIRQQFRREILQVHYLAVIGQRQQGVQETYHQVFMLDKDLLEHHVVLRVKIFRHNAFSPFYGTSILKYNTLSPQIQILKQASRTKKAYSPCLSNSNHATIMTDKNIADKIYIEPLTLTTIKRIIEKERTPCTDTSEDRTRFDELPKLAA